MKIMNPSNYYDLNSEEKKEYIDYIENKLKNDSNEMKLLKDMYAIMDDVIQHYRSDFFVHDYRILTDNNNECNSFIWFIYNSGSFLIQMERDFVQEEKKSWDFFNMICRHYGYKPAQVFIINKKEGTIQNIKAELITEDLFSNRYGDYQSYIDSKLNVDDYSLIDYLTIQNKIRELLEEYNHTPSKQAIDSILV